MARLNVNPNRMELTALREKLSIAQRGHKLLKDKQDALTQKFILLAEQTLSLRKEVEAELLKINASFTLAAAMTGQDRMLLNLSYQSAPLRLHVKRKKLLNLRAPAFEIEPAGAARAARGQLYPYSLQGTAGDMDIAAMKLRAILPALVELAEKEKSCQMLSEEISRTRRRVNALEFCTIVDIEETIAYVLMQINENERNNIARLMRLTEEEEA